jgi:hypothetical protein
MKGFMLSLRLNEWQNILMENTGAKGKRRKIQPIH